jgi:hypothetical protein
LVLTLISIRTVSDRLSGDRMTSRSAVGLLPGTYTGATVA